MKVGRSTRGRTVVASLALAFLLSSTAPAYAALTDPPGGTSETNPSAGDADWRQGWGNSLTPEFTVTSVPSNPGTETRGFLYTFSRDAVEDVPDDADSVTWDPEGLMLGHTFDLYNWFLDRNPGAKPTDLEGRWYVNMRFFSIGEIATGTAHPGFPFGIDVTKPRQVQGFTAGAVMPTQSSRRTIRWLNQEYDDLSGIWRYHLTLNGEEFRIVALDEIPSFMGAYPFMTLEDLPPGINTIGITVEDRATNVSPERKITAIVDPGWPTLSVSGPAQGSWVSGDLLLTASATDDACDPRVSFQVDGVTKMVDATPPYAYSLNTRLLKAGHHTVRVVATDLFGHSRSVTRDIYVDNTVPAISSVSDTPDPWYPCLQDGYRDVATFKAYIGEFVTDAYCDLYDESGTFLIAQGHVKNFGPGWLSFWSNGKNGVGIPLYLGKDPVSLTLKYRFRAKDRAGNWKNTAFNTIQIRNFEIVAVPGGVKVIPR